MPKRMLIDATHPEETRVVVADGTELLEYEYETSTKRQLKGNIYLAKVTRVEPSLQAAFVDFGGNRHGFLAFNEIHPDYYRIPVEDREKILAESDEEDDEEENGEPHGNGEEAEADGENVEVVGDDADEDIHELGDAHRKRVRELTRMYKIQEVIKRRQILLVQVVKEERGNKGAALTTYLSLPGRYCVLMPNTSRGGGISRKVTNPKARKQMRKLLSELEVPDGMAVIMRTAGVERTKAEIKRDYEYLRRLWDEIREQTMKSTAPTLIYEEGDVIKRALRDIYNRDIEEVIIDGENAYKAGKALMRTMIPSHAKRVQKYEDTTIPLFHRYQIEQQLDSIHDPVVNLKSGGYIVINPTEALVAIDVNSGRSTRERNVEQTAYRTNLEAAEEVARQLRMRDLAGLIVIDFIDMDESRNNHAVERKLKEAMKADRARIQIGRISHFGLLELSRQRLRSSLIEAHTQTCPTCGGVGHVRSRESTAMSILRELDEEGLRKRSSQVTVKVPTEVALYLLNQKRDSLRELEERAGFRVFVTADQSLALSDYEIERERIESEDDEEEGRAEKSTRDSAEEREGEGSRRRRRRRRRGKESGRDQQADNDTPNEDADDQDDGDAAEAASEEDADDKSESSSRDDGDREDSSGGRRRRGRRGGRRRRRSGDGDKAEATADSGTDAAAEASDAVAAVSADNDDTPADDRGAAVEDARTAAAEDDTEDRMTDPDEAEATVERDEEATVERDEEEPRPDDAASEAAAEADADEDAAGEPSDAEVETESAPVDEEVEVAEAEPETADSADEPEPDEDAEEPALEEAAGESRPEPEPDNRPRRSGWWRRAMG